MKIKKQDDKIIVYLKKEYIKLELNTILELNIYIKELLFKLKNIFNMNINGYYNVIIYRDKVYGIIVEIEKEKIEYLDYFSNQIELNTQVIEDSFLYETYDLVKNKKNYILKDKIYIQIENEIDILESIIDIVYGKKVRDIKSKAKVVVI